jgi:hypothetical protein
MLGAAPTVARSAFVSLVSSLQLVNSAGIVPLYCKNL